MVCVFGRVFGIQQVSLLSKTDPARQRQSSVGSQYYIILRCATWAVPEYSAPSRASEGEGPNHLLAPSRVLSLACVLELHAILILISWIVCNQAVHHSARSDVATHWTSKVSGACMRQHHESCGICERIVSSTRRIFGSQHCQLMSALQGLRAPQCALLRPDARASPRALASRA